MQNSDSEASNSHFGFANQKIIALAKPQSAQSQSLKKLGELCALVREIIPY